MHEGELIGQVLQSKIRMIEEDGKIMLDITDHTGGLGYKLFLDPVVASKMGQRMADLARAIYARDSGDPGRTQMQEFPTTLVGSVACD